MRRRSCSTPRSRAPPWWRTVRHTAALHRRFTPQRHTAAPHRLAFVTHVVGVAYNICELSDISSHNRTRRYVGVLVGVLSRTDLLYKLAGLRSLHVAGQGARSLRYMENTQRLMKVEAVLVRDAMTTNPISLTPQVPACAARLSPLNCV